MATKTLRVFAEYTSTGFVPMPTAGNIDYGFTLGTTFPATTPATYQTDNPNGMVIATEVTVPLPDPLLLKVFQSVEDKNPLVEALA